MALGIGIAGLLLSAGTAVDQRQQAKTAANKAEDAALDQEATAKKAADDAIAAEDEALAEADEKKRKQAAELSAGGASSQFSTGPLGLTSASTTGKKTLLGA